MVRQTDLAEHRQAVRDLVYCAQCHSPMLLTGQEFVCPQNDAGSARVCTTTATDADAVIRAVVTKFIGRLMNDKVTESLVEDAQRGLHDTYRAQTRLDSPFILGESLGLPPGALARALPPEPDPEESWMLDEQKMKETAADPRTYLDFAEPGETRELLGAFVEQIRIGPTSVELAYHTPMPDDDNRPVVNSDQILLQK